MGTLFNSPVRRDFAVLLVLAAAVAIAYGNTLHYPFVYDDQTAIVHNGFIKNFAHLPGLFRPRDYAAGINMRYRPLPAAGYFFLYRFWGLNPYGYRVGKILIHLGNGWAVFLLARVWLAESEPRRLRTGAGKSRLWAALAALIFLLHPVQAEAINCISFYHDLLATGFILIAVLSALSFSRRASPFLLGVSLSAYLLGLACKETALMFIPLLLLAPWIFPSIRQRNGFPFPRSRLFWSVAAAMTVLYALARFIWFERIETYSLTPPLSAERIVLSFRCILHYASLLIFPAQLSLDYSPPLSLLVFRAPAWLATVGALSLCTLAIWAGLRAKAARFALFWLALNLLPFLHIVSLPQIVGERYLYLPLAGWSCLAAWGARGLADWLADVRQGKYLRWVSVCLGAVLILSLLLVRTGNRRWKDERSLWRNSLRVSPESFVALNNLGWDYLQQGDKAEAERYFARVLASPAPPGIRSVAYANQAVLALSRNRPEEALERTAEALRENPLSARPYRLEGQIYLGMKQYRAAAEALLRALEMDPYDSEGYSLMGCLLAETGKIDLARQHFQRALFLNPDNIAARNNQRQVERSVSREGGR
jgi:tetratricopeptide (TPR) repeat protein